MMSDNPRQEQRRFVRVASSLPVKYKFVSSSADFAENRVYEGRTDNIGGGGMLLTGQVPSVDWITELLMEKVLIALTLDLPGGAPVKVIARVAWLEAIDQNTEVCQLGLTFKEITQENRDRILDLVIKAHAPDTSA